MTRATTTRWPIGQLRSVSRWRSRNVPSGPGIGIAVRIGFGMAEHLVHPLDQPVGDDVLEVLGVVVHLVPAHAHHLDQEQFDQAVAAQHRRRQP